MTALFPVIAKRKLSNGSSRNADKILTSFVICNSTLNMFHLAKFTSWKPKKGQKLNCPIWQAIRATLAASRGFPPVEIGRGRFKQKYVGGTRGTNNPSRQVIAEAKSMWKDEDISALISIGAGQEGVLRIADSLSSPNVWDTVSERVATDTERIVEDVKDQFEKVYFRLSVEQGLQQGVNMLPITLADIDTQTWAYLRSFDAGYLLKKAVKCLGGNSTLSNSMSTLVESRLVRRYDEEREAAAGAKEITVQVYREVSIFGRATNCRELGMPIYMA
jgi:hypothetical protein